jgi:hypothetical protein
MYKLGKYIRMRYENYLGTSPREVHIRSSAADRCLESAALVLAAICPPEGRYQYFIFNDRKYFLTKKSNFSDGSGIRDWAEVGNHFLYRQNLYLSMEYIFDLLMAKAMNYMYLLLSLYLI